MTLWQGHAPSSHDWQVLLIGKTGGEHIQQFPRKHYTLEQVVNRGDFEAAWYHCVAFAVRDTDGTVRHVGPVLNALGEAKHADWQETPHPLIAGMLADVGLVERRAA